MSGERTPEHLARDTDPRWKTLIGMVRRMVVRFARKGIWELGGFEPVSTTGSLRVLRRPV